MTSNPMAFRVSILGKQSRKCRSAVRSTFRRARKKFIPSRGPRGRSIDRHLRRRDVLGRAGTRRIVFIRTSSSPAWARRLTSASVPDRICSARARNRLPSAPRARRAAPLSRAAPSSFSLVTRPGRLRIGREFVLPAGERICPGFEPYIHTWRFRRRKKSHASDRSRPASSRFRANPGNLRPAISTRSDNVVARFENVRFDHHIIRRQHA